MARTSNFANVATVTRASTKTDAGGWDFTNGGTVGTLTEYASGVAAIHPTAGLLVEESTTNEIRNPRCEGAVAGTPGTMPTNWLVVAGGGATTEVVGSGYSNGSPYLDFRVSGSPSASTTQIYFEGSSQIVAASGETWTLSMGVELVGGSTSNLTGVHLGLIERSGAGSALAVLSDTIFTPSTPHKRYHSTWTLSNASTAYTQPRLDIEQSGGAIDVTLRIYAPQIEEKAYPTSPVFPVAASPAATTRASDYVTLSLGAWFNEPTGTMFFEYQSNTAGVSGRVIGGFGATFDNTIYLAESTTGTRWAAALRSGGAVAGLLTPAGQSDYAVGTSYKAALAYTQDDFAFSLNGATQATDTAGNVAVSPTRFVLGGAPWAAAANNSFNGFIKDLRYWPKRLTNAELEALVGN